MDKMENKASFIRQLLASMSIYTLSMSMGASAGFSGVAIPQLKLGPDEGGFGFSEEQISWIASLQVFSIFSTCVLGGFLGEYMGRKTLCLLVCPIYLAGFLCVALSPDPHLLFFGRILGGIASGLVSASAGVYVSEISTSDWKTTLNAWLSSFYMVGMVTVFTFGKWLSWRWISGVSCIFPVLGLILLFQIPESPSWLVTQGRISDARSALIWLRGDHYDISEEFNKLETSYLITQAKGKSEKKGCCTKFWKTTLEAITKLKRPDVFKPLFLVTLLMLLQQFSGVATITYYAVTLMGDGKRLDKYSATIIYGFTRLASTLIGGLLLRKFARRPLLICSSLLVALGMSLLGASFYMSQNQEDEESSIIMEILPLISVILPAVAYQLGLGPIGWAYMSELYPVDMRSVLSGFSSMLTNLYIFLVVKTFPTLKESELQPWGTYWLYASVAICAAIFGATLLPETKGKTLAEVSEHFYVCCTFSKQSKDIVEIEYMPVGEKIQDDTLSQSFIYRNNDRDMMNGSREDELDKVERRFKRRSLELKDVEGSLKRRTLELSQLDVMIQEKERELSEREQRLKRGSAPIVQLDELDDLLLQI